MSSGPRASCALKVMSALEARGPAEHEKTAFLPGCLLHHACDVGGFGVGIGLTVRLMFGDELSFQPLVYPGFFRMSAQIVPERQPLPYLSLWLRDMYVMGAF